MAFVEPIELAAGGVRLLPLNLTHEAGLQAAASDGELWNLRITSVPEQHEVRSYIQTALSTDNRLAFAVLDAASGEVLGSTSYHDIVPVLKRVEIGYTWYAFLLYPALRQTAGFSQGIPDAAGSLTGGRGRAQQRRL